jgi:hypothetical protein
MIQSPGTVIAVRGRACAKGAPLCLPLDAGCVKGDIGAVSRLKIGCSCQVADGKLASRADTLPVQLPTPSSLLELCFS